MNARCHFGMTTRSRMTLKLRVLLPLDHPASSLSIVPLTALLSAGCKGKCVLVTAATADKIKHTFSKKREQKSFSAYHKRPALMKPVCTTVSTPCHMGRGLAGHSRCVSVGNDYGKTRLCSSIRSKTTVLPWCARHHTSAQRWWICWNRSHRNFSSSPERVRLLQQLLPSLPKKKEKKKTVTCELF